MIALAGRFAIRAFGPMMRAARTTMARLLGVVALMLVLTLGAVAAQPLDDALEAYASGNHAMALQLLRPLAEDGDARAQNILGIMYEDGRGVAQDCATAAHWYRRAADQGLAEAQANLGTMSLYGTGVARDTAAAAQWFRLAAEQGNDGAMYSLAFIYEEGLGVAQDLVRAHAWFTLAAARAEADALFPEEAPVSLSAAVEARERVAARLTPDQAAAAERLARVLPALATPSPTAEPMRPPTIRLPETGYVVMPGSVEFSPVASPSANRMVAALMAWISATSGLPATDARPNFAFAPPAVIAAMPNGNVGGAHQEIGDHPQRRDIVALYDNATQTIYLPDGWTGSTGTELSVLVHELVHHLQNIAGLRFACPQERERLAYEVQERWLNLFGTTLESAFQIDPFTLRVITNCAY